MTQEQFERLREIGNETERLEKENEALKAKVARIDDYIKLVKADDNTVKSRITGKVYSTVQCQFITGDNPTETDARDYGFNVILENKDDFISFLKQCQKNYKAVIKKNEKTLADLQAEFAAA